MDKNKKNILAGIASLVIILTFGFVIAPKSPDSVESLAEHNGLHLSGTSLQYVDGQGGLHPFPSLATVATTGVYNDLSGKPTIPSAQIQSDFNQATSSSLDYIKNKPGIWYNGTLITSTNDMTFSGTTTSGSVTFYMTNGGLVGGTALCTANPKTVQIGFNDSTNSFGYSYAITNSFKTLTITATYRTFTSGNVLLNLLGTLTSVLTGSTMATVPNGTPIIARVLCN